MIPGLGATISADHERDTDNGIQVARACGLGIPLQESPCRRISAEQVAGVNISPPLTAAALLLLVPKAIADTTSRTPQYTTASLLSTCVPRPSKAAPRPHAQNRKQKAKRTSRRDSR
jgi:hypothetical protein